jgi:hypothetical protein
MKNKISILLFGLIIFMVCWESLKVNYYVKLEDFKYTPATIKDGTEIKILSYSGGKECSGKEIYYYQFIGIDNSTLDTVRILAPCQLFDVTRGTKTGIFYNDGISKVFDLLLKDSKEDVFKMSDKENFVVFNKKAESLEKRNFRTAIGSLAFK